MAMKPIEILIEAKSTGDAEIDALNKKLSTLSEQQGLIDSFVKVKKETEEAAEAFDAAQEKAQKLGRDLAATEEPTKKQAADFARARDAVNGAKDSYQELQLKLQGAREQLNSAGISSTNLAKSQGELRDQVQLASKAVGDRRKSLDDAAKAENEASQAAKLHADAIKRAAEESKAAASVAASEIALSRQHLGLEKEQQQALLQSARARGDAAAAQAASNRLREIEAQQLSLTARAKREEAAAIAAATDQRRSELAAIGPITKAQQLELQNSGNLEKALRVESVAHETAASATRSHAQGIDKAAESTGKYQGALKEIAGAVAGAFAVSKVVNFAKSVGEISDQYKNLQARIQLVTGEGEDFKQSWQGVTDVALRTHAALEETGVLFARLAQAGKDAGLSAADASTQSLALTETINQSLAISGASATASSAAITQLIQGLQSGVLRGEEFNSIMEQSPRLARALSDSLGLTTGELRKMAEAGGLTTGVVIDALRGQSEAIATEFQKLPPTVGRALQDLSTQWTLYVAETDKATGASTAAATVINALAGSLQTIAGLLLDVGQAGAALAALKLAQHFLGIGAAAQGAAVAVAATNAQMVATSAAAATAATAASRFSMILGGLRTFTLIGLVSNFRDIGTWIGESAAKLAGYKDRTEELAQAEKAHAAIAKEAASDRMRLAESIQAAIDKQFELSKAARAGVAEFEKLTKEGTSSAEAIKKVSASFDLSKLQGIKDFSAVLDKLTADGKVSASEFEKAWSQALSGKDLAQFEVMARAAFADSAREGERVAQMMDGVLRESVKRTGLDFDNLQGKIGAASRSAINDLEVVIGGLDKLKAQGVDAGRVLSASLSKAIDAADSEKALEVLRAKIEQVRSTLGEKIADDLLDQAKEKTDALADALDKATPGINSVREAMKQLGITTDATLKKTADDAKAAYDTLASSGTASAREMGEAFKAAAEKAIAANNGVAPSWVEARAAAAGYRVEVDAAGKTVVKSMNDAASATRAVGAAARNAADNYKLLGANAEQASVGVRKLAEAGQMLAAAEQLRQDARNKELEDSRYMNGPTTNPVDAVPTFNSKEEAEAWRKQWQAQYERDNPFSTKRKGQLGSFMYDLTMFEYKKELDALALRDAMKNAAPGGRETSSTQMPTAGTTTTAVTINVEGTSRTINTDADGVATLQELIRQLKQGKSTALR